MKRSVAAVVALLTLVLTGLVGASTLAGAAPGASARSNAGYTAGRYLVTFVDDPIASYEGYAAGYPATRPAPGTKLEAASASARR